MKTLRNSWNTALRLILLALFPFLIVIAGYSQNKNQESQPDVKVDVKREYDEQGNLKNYDSIYSYSYSWSGKEDINLDSVLRSINQNYGFSPFLDDDFFGMYKFPHRLTPNESENDSLYGYINPNDSVYTFKPPHNSFNYGLNDPFFYDFFNDPFFSKPGINQHGFIEDHLKMIEELRKNFNFSFPEIQSLPDDTVPKNEKQKLVNPGKQKPQGFEI